MKPRMVAGLMLGIVIGSLGPMLGAVAWHSGNGSGNTPLAAAAELLVEDHASAVWFGPSQIEVVRYTGAAGHLAEQRQEASAGGVVEVIARGALCESWPCEPGHEWRGSFVTPSDPQDMLFVMDPLAGTALLEATLRDEATGEPCRFSVTWGTRAPDHVDVDAGSSIEQRERVLVDGGSNATRSTGDAKVVAECWNTDAWTEFGHGNGVLASSLVLEADIAREHLCVFVPRSGRVCPFDD